MKIDNFTDKHKINKGNNLHEFYFDAVKNREEVHKLPLLFFIDIITKSAVNSGSFQNSDSIL